MSVDRESNRADVLHLKQAAIRRAPDVDGGNMEDTVVDISTALLRRLQMQALEHQTGGLNFLKSLDRHFSNIKSRFANDTEKFEHISTVLDYYFGLFSAIIQKIEVSGFFMEVEEDEDGHVDIGKSSIDLSSDEELKTIKKYLDKCPRGIYLLLYDFEKNFGNNDSVTPQVVLVKELSKMPDGGWKMNMDLYSDPEESDGEIKASALKNLTIRNSIKINALFSHTKAYVFLPDMTGRPPGKKAALRKAA